MNRRAFLELAAALGASAAWGVAPGAMRQWRERRDLFPQGVASGDPDSHSLLLWTRCPRDPSSTDSLRVELAADASFSRLVARSQVEISAEADWTCRVLVGGLEPDTLYWYRFADARGNGSRIGRTRTAPLPDAARPVSFAFVSCQNANLGAQNAYRRMIFEDAAGGDHPPIDFVLHLGDFIYELVWYPRDRPQGMYDRAIRDLLRYPHGERIDDFHIPASLDDYRAVYKAYLTDPDLQDARAHWPFVNMWDNHEFSWLGWQSLQKFDGRTRPAQTRKVAANQAFFEFQPARMRRPAAAGGRARSLERFDPPKVRDTPVTHFDSHGLGLDADNLAAIGSLQGYRALRWGRHVELIITDQRSYRSEEPLGREEAKPLESKTFPQLLPEEAMRVLDAGRDYDAGHPPTTIRASDGSVQIDNFRAAEPAQTILGERQMEWFLERLTQSRATWKIWGNTVATLEMRADPQNLPPGLTSPWPWAGYAGIAGGDHSTAYLERARIYDTIGERGIAGFVTVAGDRHSFWAGYAAKALPPRPFVPVGIAFVTGSISAPGVIEALEHSLPQQHPLRGLFVGQGPRDARPRPTMNMLLRHGVRSCLEYVQTGDAERAKQMSNPELAPHVTFVDMGGHGYSVVTAASDRIETEFVCIPRPVERSDRTDGGPIVYRARSRSFLWAPGEKPHLETTVVEGEAIFST